MTVSFLLLALVVAPVAARADGSDCNITAGASIDSPHLADPAGDWTGIATGDGSGLFGDVNQQSADILAVWFTSQAGKVVGHIALASLNDPTKGAELNESVYITFKNPRSKIKSGGNPVNDVYLYANLTGRGAATFGYGYVAPPTTPGTSGTLTSAGSTQGTYTAGAPGVLDIVLPNALGQPQAGDLLENPGGVVRFMVGSPSVTGLLYVVEDTLNADGCLDAITV